MTVAKGRTQRHVYPNLKGCLVGANDVDLVTMALGVAPMILALEALGSWTFVAVREMNGNLDKIDESAAANELESNGEPRTLANVLSWEIEAELHGPGGDLVEDSAAKGALPEPPINTCRPVLPGSRRRPRHRRPRLAARARCLH